MVCPEGELLPIFTVLWVASVVIVALGVARHETFAAEGTLAIFIDLTVPFLMRDAITSWLRRVWRRLSS